MDAFKVKLPDGRLTGAAAMTMPFKRALVGKGEKGQWIAFRILYTDEPLEFWQIEYGDRYTDIQFAPLEAANIYEVPQRYS